MKYCPSCQIKYADETLQFCLQDGTGLLDHSGDAPAPTVAFSESEQETVVRQKPVTSDWVPSRVTENATVQPEAKKSKILPAILLTALVMCVFFGGIFAVWRFLGNNSSDNANGRNKTATPTITPTINMTPTIDRTPVIEKTPAIDRTPPPDGSEMWQPIDYNASLNGERLTYYRGTTVEACRADCEANAKCAGFGLVRAGYYNPSDPPMCYLLSKVTSSTPSTCCISAIKK